MSRSRKKFALVSDYSRSYTPYAKSQASRAVRRYKGRLTDGSLFKKVYPTWDIFDYKWRFYVCDEHIKHPERNREEWNGMTHNDREHYTRK